MSTLSLKERQWLRQYQLEIASRLIRQSPSQSKAKLNEAVNLAVVHTLFLEQIGGIASLFLSEWLPNVPLDDCWPASGGDLAAGKRKEYRDSWPSAAELGSATRATVGEPILLKPRDGPRTHQIEERRNDHHADFLGQVYEHLLGSPVSVAPDGTALANSDGQGRKGSGVFYTPASIVQYIVRQTVVPLLAGKVPADLAEDGPPASSSMEILDPCCGGGAFLTGAYRFLLDWYRDRYLDAGPARGWERLARDSSDQWQLILPERWRILRKHIFGADLDPVALAVTKFSLLLTLFEAPLPATNEQLELLPPTLWAELDANLKRGDALVGSDFAVPGVALGALNGEDLTPHIDWSTDFPPVFARKDGGFAAVIGNPPYVFGEYQSVTVKGYLASRYALARDQYDLYWPFVELGLRLTARSGRCAMIVPDALLARDEARDLRALLLNEGLERVYHCGRVFDLNVSTAIFVVQKGARPATVIGEIAGREGNRIEHHCSRQRMLTDRRRRFLIHTTEAEAALLDLLQANRQMLGRFIRLTRGEETGKGQLSPRGSIPVLAGDDVSRYRLRPSSRYLARIEKRLSNYRGPKIVLVKTGYRCVAALDDIGTVTLQSLYNIHAVGPDLSLEALLGLLNSSLVDFFVRKTCTAYKLVFPQINQSTILGLPVSPALIQNQQTLASLVTQMLTEQGEMSDLLARTSAADHATSIATLDEEIDRWVCEQYGLSSSQYEIVKCQTAAVYETAAV